MERFITVLWLSKTLNILEQYEEEGSGRILKHVNSLVLVFNYLRHLRRVRILLGN